MFGNNIFGASSSLTFGKVLGGISKVLNVANQAIPLYQQAKPVFNNAKSAFSLIKEFRNDDKKESKNNKSNEILTKNIIKTEKDLGVIKKSSPVFFQ